MTSARKYAIATILLICAVLAGLLLEEMGWCLFVAAMIWIVLQTTADRKTLAWPRHSSTHEATEGLWDHLGLAEVIPDGVIVMSPDGDIQRINRAAQNLLQLSEKDIGLELATVVRSPNFVAYVRSVKPQDEPLDFVSPIDPNRFFEARRFDTDTGQTIILLRDITDLNRLLTMRQNFIANVSHELRTPITVVAGYLETMTDHDQSEALRLSLIDRLEQPVKRMQTLVDDLMMLTQLESKPIAETKQPVRLKQIVQTAVAELQGLCVHPDQLVLSVGADDTVLGIESELHSACINMISNALRYSPEGNSVDISLSEHGSKVRLTVSDHGYGIAPEHLNHITERFYRVDMAGSRTRGGTGLGLAIVKHVLRRHDSELQVHSTLGRGSVFYFELTRAPTADAQIPSERDSTSQATLEVARQEEDS
jgi:two-component system phosphate regulon sensor histidine kinase PhoR